ncbi:unnamed protein product [Cyprideis torosa]|uniref:Uncharacterized protein n=1 Tax=Cyprideis torosa TaxID=163714 RepID=A0A7R8WAK9_9CRUS|nr:unnamed protein product [Cyprideis torosa]CAG0888504.1 unnamed protein product [Cyprideis torosa]
MVFQEGGLAEEEEPQPPWEGQLDGRNLGTGLWFGLLMIILCSIYWSSMFLTALACLWLTEAFSDEDEGGNGSRRTSADDPNGLDSDSGNSGTVTSTTGKTKFKERIVLYHPLPDKRRVKRDIWSLLPFKLRPEIFRRVSDAEKRRRRNHESREQLVQDRAGKGERERMGETFRWWNPLKKSTGGNKNGTLATGRGGKGHDRNQLDKKQADKRKSTSTEKSLELEVTGPMARGSQKDAFLNSSKFFETVEVLAHSSDRKTVVRPRRSDASPADGETHTLLQTKGMTQRHPPAPILAKHVTKGEFVPDVLDQRTYTDAVPFKTPDREVLPTVSKPRTSLPRPPDYKVSPRTQEPEGSSPSTKRSGRETSSLSPQRSGKGDWGPAAKGAVDPETGYFYLKEIPLRAGFPGQCLPHPALPTTDDRGGKEVLPPPVPSRKTAPRTPPPTPASTEVDLRAPGPGPEELGLKRPSGEDVSEDTVRPQKRKKGSITRPQPPPDPTNGTRPDTPSPRRTEEQKIPSPALTEEQGIRSPTRTEAQGRSASSQKDDQGTVSPARGSVGKVPSPSRGSVGKGAPSPSRGSVGKGVPSPARSEKQEQTASAIHRDPKEGPPFAALETLQEIPSPGSTDALQVIPSPKSTGDMAVPVVSPVQVTRMVYKSPKDVRGRQKYRMKDVGGSAPPSTSADPGVRKKEGASVDTSLTSTSTVGTEEGKSKKKTKKKKKRWFSFLRGSRKTESKTGEVEGTTTASEEVRKQTDTAQDPRPHSRKSRKDIFLDQQATSPMDTEEGRGSERRGGQTSSSTQKSTMKERTSTTDSWLSSSPSSAAKSPTRTGGGSAKKRLKPPSKPPSQPDTARSTPTPAKMRKAVLAVKYQSLEDSEADSAGDSVREAAAFRPNTPMLRGAAVDKRIQTKRPLSPDDMRCSKVGSKTLLAVRSIPKFRVVKNKIDQDYLCQYQT